MFEVLLAIWLMPTMGWRWLLGLSTAPLVVFVTFCFVSITNELRPAVSMVLRQRLTRITKVGDTEHIGSG